MVFLLSSCLLLSQHHRLSEEPAFPRGARGGQRPCFCHLRLQRRSRLPLLEAPRSAFWRPGVSIYKTVTFLDQHRQNQEVSCLGGLMAKSCAVVESLVLVCHVVPAARSWKGRPLVRSIRPRDAGVDAGKSVRQKKHADKEVNGNESVPTWGRQAPWGTRSSDHTGPGASALGVAPGWIFTQRHNPCCVRRRRAETLDV